MAAERQNLELVEQLSALGSEQSKEEASVKAQQAALDEVQSRGEASSLARNAFVGKLHERREKLEQECQRHQQAAERVNQLLGHVAQPSFHAFQALLAREPSPDAQVQSILASGPSVMTLPVVMGHVEERVVSAVQRIRQTKPQLLEDLDTDGSAASGQDGAGEEHRPRPSGRKHGRPEEKQPHSGARRGRGPGPSLPRVLPPTTSDLAPESEDDTDGEASGPEAGGEQGAEASEDGEEDGAEAGSQRPRLRVDKYEDLWGHAQEYAKIHADVAASLRQKAQDARARLAARKQRSAEAAAAEKGAADDGPGTRQRSAGGRTQGSHRTQSRLTERSPSQAQHPPTSASAHGRGATLSTVGLGLRDAVAAEGDVEAEEEIRKQRLASKQRARDYQRREAAKSARAAAGQQPPAQVGSTSGGSPRAASPSQSLGTPRSSARPQSGGAAGPIGASTRVSSQTSPQHPLYHRFSEMGLEAAMAGAPMLHPSTGSPRAEKSAVAEESAQEESQESSAPVERERTSEVVEYGRSQDNS